mmetsp:Transcript_2263/g.3141  ORF Transcript_2263/g.3141 Transcript_2263/m.3141 type:complete len:781 (-) Transcript_2263:172-2514(-)|eukprot:CAMPEP_0117740924 /NCGR_PEP_ID=MMETSP0947-20121206/4618_1 /TAXON_ID=44440 /ORGANISM="Chattonella subsalsa, Strain CCMP2191" /LENGTH=780 /DNA_ID=CAMNT_0005557105 /DNA_START=217 /DNA_END=2559 /DNA_ORIENTATION=-
MKFGKQLQLQLYVPWREKYLAYGRFKRLIKRLVYLRDHKQEAETSRLQREFSFSAGKVLGRSRSMEDRDGSSRSQKLIKNPLIKAAVRGDPALSQMIKDTEMTPLHTEQRAYSEGGKLSEACYSGSQLKSHREERAKILRPKSRRISDFSEESDVKNLREDWDRSLTEEIDKVNDFFSEKLEELQNRVEYFVEHHTQDGTQVYAGHSNFSTLRQLYTEVIALEKYSDLNWTGFRKILKKHDKALHTSLLQKHMPKIECEPFVTNLAPVEELKLSIEDMVGRAHLPMFVQKAVKQSQGERIRLFRTVKWPGLTFSVAVLIFFMNVRTMSFPTDNEMQCFAMLMFLTCMWVTEAVPYFVTALLIPALITLMEFMTLGKYYDSTVVAKKLMGSMVNNTTILILGGFSISAAFSKCGIEIHIASFLQKAFGTSPKIFALTVMLTGLFLSMWISNHTAPVLCISFITPILRDLPVGSAYAKFILLGLAFACNFGGMMTPISSMQNALSVNALQNAGYAVSFGGWIACATPYCVLGVIATWVMLILLLQPRDVLHIPAIINKKKPEPLLTKRNIFVVVTSLATVLLWSTIGVTEVFFGDLGIISLLYMGLMFGSGILTQYDFNSFSWHLLFLLGGGDVLGKAIQTTDLLTFLSTGILNALPQDNLWLMTLLCSFFAMFIATFVSHTVAAIVLMPLIVQLGTDLNLGPNLGVGVAFAVSTAMSLPFSSFPNMNSLMVVDDLHRPYLNLIDFVKTGIPMSIVAVLLLCTIGFLLISEIFPDQRVFGDS